MPEGLILSSLRIASRKTRGDFPGDALDFGQPPSFINRLPKSSGERKSGAGKPRPLPKHYFGRKSFFNATILLSVAGGKKRFLPDTPLSPFGLHFVFASAESLFHCGDLVVGRRWRKKVFAPALRPKPSRFGRSAGVMKLRPLPKHYFVFAS